MIYFKAVRWFNNNLYSVYNCSNNYDVENPPSTVLRYVIEKLTRRILGSPGIYIFDNLQDVKNYVEFWAPTFFKHNESIKIISCRIIGEARLIKFDLEWMDNPQQFFQQNQKKLRNNIIETLNLYYTHPTPENTFVVSGIIPLEILR